MLGVNSLYKNTLEQVLAIELKKKDLSHKILLLKEGKRKWTHMYTFLSYDVSKHELLEHITVVFMQNKEDELIKQIENFYLYRNDADVLVAIRKEIKTDLAFMEVVKKQLNHPANLTFVEKRMLNEISKFIIEMAREYMKMKL